MAREIFKKQPRYIPDEKDPRDYIFSAPHPTKLPERVDLRKYTPQVEQQGHLSSCTANAGVNSLEILLYKANKFRDLSRLFLYWIVREPYPWLLEKDAGAYLRDVYKQASKYGVCWEDVWPYDESKVNVEPSDEAYEDAAKKLVKEYRRIVEYLNDDEYAITATKIAIAQGFPVIVGAEVTEDLFYVRGPLEKQDYKGTLKEGAKVVGGHAMCVVGYDDRLGGFIVENSWGKEWGDGGFFLLKYDVALKDIHDAWVCTKFWDVAFEPEWERGHNLTDYDTVERNLNIEDVLDLWDSYVVLECTVSRGIEPFEYEWQFVEGVGIYKNLMYPSEDGRACRVKVCPMHEPMTWVYCCQVTDSGDPPYRVRQYFKLHIDSADYYDKTTIEKVFLAYLRKPATAEEMQAELPKFRQFQDRRDYSADFVSRYNWHASDKGSLIRELTQFLYDREATDSDIQEYSKYSVDGIPHMMVFLAKSKDYSKVCRKAKVARMVTNVLIREGLTDVDEDILKYPVERCEEFESYTVVKDYITKQVEERKRRKEDEKREHREDDRKDEDDDDEGLKKFIPLAIILAILLLLVVLTLLT